MDRSLLGSLEIPHILGILGIRGIPKSLGLQGIQGILKVSSPGHGSHFFAKLTDASQVVRKLCWDISKAMQVIPKQRRSCQNDK